MMERDLGNPGRGVTIGRTVCLCFFFAMRERKV